MIYFCLNILLTGFLLWFSFHVDKMFEKRNDEFINSILLLVVSVFFQSILLLMPYYDNPKIWLFLSKVELALIALFLVQSCFYCIRFPSFKKSGFLQFVKIVFMVFAVYLVFAHVESVTVSLTEGLTVVSAKITAGLPFTWMQLYKYLYLYALPGIAVLSMLLCSENRKSPLNRQKMMFNIAAVAVLEVVGAVLEFAATFIPVFIVLYPFCFTAYMLVLYRSIRVNVLFDFKYMVQKSMQVLFSFILPALLCGAGVALLLRFRSGRPAAYAILVLLVSALMLFFAVYVKKYFKQKNSSLNVMYEKQFEKDLASLNYNEGLDEVTGRLNALFAENIGTSALDILMLSGSAEFETAYSSSGKSLSVPASGAAFDILLNMNRTVIFKNQLEIQHSLAGVKAEMTDLFNKTHSEVCILLVEGRHIFGMILLAEKRLGNIYTEYDFSVFSKLYPYFFVVGYYMRSVANESVVGTVNREIQMSEQIIRSIQENMDFIKNPKVDAGYLMVPAHNIGGEFIDFIRLTDERHIFVLGALSGKGITASMSMVILKSIIRTFLAETKDFKELVQKVNSFIRFNLPKGTFFAGVFGLIDFRDNTMYYINCGVPALFLYTQAYNNVIEIQGEGRVLGFVKNIDRLLKIKKVKLNAGDIIVACTAGLIESHSLRGETFGKDRIQKAITENLMYTSDKMAQFTYQNLQSFTSKELEDDISILVIKYLNR